VLADRGVPSAVRSVPLHEQRFIAIAAARQPWNRSAAFESSSSAGQLCLDWTIPCPAAARPIAADLLYFGA
jgi:hypothetical protein